MLGRSRTVDLNGQEKQSIDSQCGLKHPPGILEGAGCSGRWKPGDGLGPPSCLCISKHSASLGLYCPLKRPHKHCP